MGRKLFIAGRVFVALAIYESPLARRSQWICFPYPKAVFCNDNKGRARGRDSSEVDFILRTWFRLWALGEEEVDVLYFLCQISVTGQRSRVSSVEFG